nr:hypothetical protein E2R29_04100 [Burkholderia pseudomallei]
MVGLKRSGAPIRNRQKRESTAFVGPRPSVAAIRAGRAVQSDLSRYRKFMKSPKVFRHPAAKRLSGLCSSPATGPGGGRRRIRGTLPPVSIEASRWRHPFLEGFLRTTSRSIPARRAR